MALFEAYERRIKQIDAVLNSYGSRDPSGSDCYGSTEH